MKIRLNGNREYELVCSSDELFKIQVGLELRKNDAVRLRELAKNDVVRFRELAACADPEWAKAYEAQINVLDGMLGEINY